MAKQGCRTRRGCLRILGGCKAVIGSAPRNVRIVFAFGFVLAGFMCLAGCASRGAIPVQAMRPEYEPPAARVVKTLDLTKLSRPTDEENRLQPGDFIEVTCSNLFEEARKETFPLRVEGDGTVSLPLLRNRVPVATLTISEAERVMRTAYQTSHVIRHPHLTARMLDGKRNKVYVIGAVKKPGMYQLRPDHSDPLRAIAAAEGLSDDAGTVVEIRRAARVPAGQQPAPGEIVRVDSQWGAQNADAATAAGGRGVVSWPARTDNTHQGETLMFRGSAAKTVVEEKILRFDLTGNDMRHKPDLLQLQNGDIVSVEQKKPRPFFVTGSVNKGGEFPMPTDRDVRVLEAVGMAGGVLSSSDPNNVLLIRRPEGMQPIVIHLKLDRAAKNPAENLRLMEGDVVNVVEDAASQTRRVIRQFLHLGIGAPVVPN
jgi:protein involved in polysaccharide export with SLBB domain